MKWLYVIARNSSFAYKGRAVDVKQVGRELGIRYVLEGSLRKAGDRIRITCQLIETANGTHVWAERYDRPLGNIFEVQDEITLSVVGAIEPSLRQAEIERAKRKRPDSLDAYDLYLRALPHAQVAMPGDGEKALLWLQKSLALEPDYAAAHALAASAKTAPATSESPAQGRQFYADETPMPGDRRRSSEIASGSLPFTVTGNRFSAPNNNWLGSRPICGPSFGRADRQFNPFEASPAAWRCSPRCGWPRPTSPSVRLMSLRWRQPVLDPSGLGFLDGVQVDQRGELGPFLFDRDQQFIERDVVHVATDVPGKAHRR